MTSSGPTTRGELSRLRSMRCRKPPRFMRRPAMRRLLHSLNIRPHRHRPRLIVNYSKGRDEFFMSAFLPHMNHDACLKIARITKSPKHSLNLSESDEPCSSPPFNHVSSCSLLTLPVSPVCWFRPRRVTLPRKLGLGGLEMDGSQSVVYRCVPDI